ncbi:MAG: hypothetical protein ABFD80_12865 [Acidobacteriota bacterium]
MGLILLLAVTPGCQKKAAAPQAGAQPQKALNVYEGTVKTAFGKYLYLPSAQGFDIVLEGFDAAALVGKDIRVKGELLLDKPSIFRADTVEQKISGSYTSVYTRSQEPTLGDIIDVATRETYKILTLTGVNNTEDWENKGKAKIFGKIKENGAASYIVVTDEKGKEVGKIVVDQISEFSKYYLKKLRLFDTFWFYVNVKNTVDQRDRVKTKELFHADIQLIGLF